MRQKITHSGQESDGMSAKISLPEASSKSQASLRNFQVEERFVVRTLAMVALMLLAGLCARLLRRVFTRMI